MKLTAMLIALMLSMNVSAFGSNQGQGQEMGQVQGQQMGQSTDVKNILAAAASNRTIVDLTSKNTNLNANKNTNLNANISDNSNSLSNRVSNDTRVMNGSYSEGSYSKSNSGALSGSKSRAGDNTNNITIEGDYTDYPPASAMAGIATECVNTLAAQSKTFGISLGGESPDCKALRTALSFFQLASSFEKSDPEMAEYYMAQGHNYAKKSGVTAATLFMSETRGFLVDLGISIAIIAKLGLIIS